MDKNSLAVDVFNRNAINYKQAFSDVSGYSDSLNFFLKQLPHNASVLDLACGPGNVATFLFERNPSLNILGFDLSEDMVKLAKSSCEWGSFQVGDCRKIDLDQSFDGILLSFILPYLDLVEVTNLFHSVRTNLTENGSIYLSTMEGTEEMSGLQTSPAGNSLYMYYYVQSKLDALIEEAGLSISYFKRQPFIHPNGTPFSDLIYVLKKR